MFFFHWMRSANSIGICGFASWISSVHSTVNYLHRSQGRIIIHKPQNNHPNILPNDFGHFQLGYSNFPCQFCHPSSNLIFFLKWIAGTRSVFRDDVKPISAYATVIQTLHRFSTFIHVPGRILNKCWCVRVCIYFLLIETIPSSMSHWFLPLSRWHNWKHYSNIIPLIVISRFTRTVMYYNDIFSLLVSIQFSILHPILEI